MSKHIAVVTGASRGLGLETARQLLNKGAFVIVTARKAEAAEAALKNIGPGENGSSDELDISSDASVDAFFDRLVARHGRIDILVNNAGRIYGGYGKSLAETPADIVAEAFNNNTLGAMRMIARALPLMQRNGYGRIVNVSTGMAGLAEMGTGAAPYRLSKTALNAVTRIAAGEAGGNIKVNSVCPGWVRTDMGGPGATRSVEQGAAGIVWAATLPDGGPTGGFFRDGQPVPW